MREHAEAAGVADGAVITSPANPQVKSLVALRRRKTRDAEGVTIIDGYDELSLVVAAGVTPRALYVCPELVSDPSRLALLERLSGRGVSVVRLGREAFAKAAYRESPDGWLAVVESPERSLQSIVLPERPLVLIAESVEKPGNLGAMVRTADATGVAVVVAAPPGTDWGNPNVVRASKGTVFAVPVASATADQTIAWAAGHALPILVATPDASVLLSEADLAGGCALVVGAEHAGVGEAWRHAAEVCLRIPMTGRVNSLNVATSAAVLLFEAVRQRMG